MTTSSMTGERAHQETRDLIPWWVNGRLTEAEARQVEAHLEECAECRADAEMERRVLVAMRQKSQVAYAPQVSMQKLWQRIDEVERDVPVSPPPDVPRTAHVSVAGSSQRWHLAAAVLVGLGVGLVGADTWRSAVPGDVPQFRTVTTPQRTAGRPAQIRVVFSPGVTVDELAVIVGGNGYSIVDGPSESGVYGLAAAASGGEIPVTELLARLRADPRIRFAEPATGSGSIAGP